MDKLTVITDKRVFRDIVKIYWTRKLLIDAGGWTHKFNKIIKVLKNIEENENE